MALNDGSQGGMGNPSLFGPFSGQSEQIGGLLQNMVANGGITNQLLGQIAEILSNTGTVAATGSVTSSSPTAGVGYATGAGGTVTQATSKTTGVTINKVCGQITMNNALLGAGSEATFTVTNSAATTLTLAIVNHVSGGTSGAYMAQASAFTNGTFQITVSNLSGGSLSEAIVLGFALIRYTTT